jgi:uncharacterized OB-fold protein
LTLRPVMPAANPDTQPFWDGCARGVFLLQRCTVCSTFRHPPSPICPTCLSSEHEWLEATGQGSIYTFVIVRESLRRGWEELVPYVVAVVDLDEGPKLVTNVINIDPDLVTIGLRGKIVFTPMDGAMMLPVFAP